MRTFFKNTLIVTIISVFMYVSFMYLMPNDKTNAKTTKRKKHDHILNSNV